jgi:hypothetical protein
LIGLADARRRLGDPEQARRYAEHAATLSSTTDHRVLEGQARVAWANALTDLGRHAGAVDQARLAFDVQRATGYRLGTAHALMALGRALARSDRVAARAHRRQAGWILADIGAAGDDG